MESGESKLERMGIVQQPDEQLGFLLTQVSFLKQRIINVELKELDLTYIQFIILAGILELSEEGMVVSQQTIVVKRRLDKAMVSVVIKALITRGLVLRHPHPTDKRAYKLILTKEGEKKVLLGKEITLKIDQHFFAEIDKERLFEIFNKLLLYKED